MKRRYKMLPLTFPFTHKSWWEECVRAEDKIEPIFRRNGYFLDRQNGMTWLEIDGEAWLYRNRQDFLFDLEHSPGNNRLHPEALHALETLNKYKMLPWGSKLRNALEVESEMRALRQVYVSSKKAYAHLILARKRKK